MKAGIILAGCVLGSMLSVVRVTAQSDGDFKGKTIRLIIGTSSGGGVDLYARLVAQFLGKHLPGEPVLSPAEHAGGQFCGGGELSLLGRQTRWLDARRFARWRVFRSSAGPQHGEVRLGEVYLDRFAGTARGATLHARRQPVQDPRRYSARREPPRCGGAGTGATGYFVPKILEETLGLKFKTVTGYQSGGEIDIAVERGELHCRAFDIGSFVGRDPTRTWFKNGYVKSLLQTGMKRDSRLGDVPTLYELMDKQKTPDSLRRMASCCFVLRRIRPADGGAARDG